jgi:hypothetical protein
MYSSSNFPTHHIFFPPRLELVTFQQHPNGLSAHAGNKFALDNFFGQQPHRPARPPLWRRRADHGDNALLLLLIQAWSLARTRRIKQCALQTAIDVPLSDLPHCLGGKPQVSTHCGGGMPLIHLTQGQGAQGCAHRLQPAAQQLLYLLPISRLQLNLKSLASAHTSAIQPEMASDKYLL